MYIYMYMYLYVYMQSILLPVTFSVALSEA